MKLSTNRRDSGFWVYMINDFHVPRTFQPTNASSQLSVRATAPQSWSGSTLRNADAQGYRGCRAKKLDSGIGSRVDNRTSVKR